LLHLSPLAPTAAALRNGELDLFDYIEQVCDRIERIDVHIESFLPESDRFSRLKTAAKALQDRFPKPASRPPLYGVPVGVKDIFRVDGFATRAGSQLPPELFEGNEATCVQKLKAAGALVLGKTMTTEFAYFEPGPTRNPHNLKHTPGGSSSGSAAAVAAGLCPLALGTQTIGSIIRPAAFCGVVGFKPTYGRIDPAGVIFIAPSLDHIGMFTQDVEGMILAASVLCEGWRDVEVELLPVLGVPEGAYLQQASPEGLQAFDEQLQRLEQAGYTVRKAAALDNIAEIIQYHRALMAGEVAQVHQAWFAHHESLYRPRTAEMIRMGQQVEDEALKGAREMQKGLRAELEAAMASAGIDLWVCPAATGAAPEGLDSTGDPAMSFPWTFARLPTVAFPAGYSASRLPLGLQCVGAFGRDEQLLAWAKQLVDSLALRAPAP
jgi:Asp-tRNA(Asn)/Glu-tRNA(Gln) amidotransferase A subunit family amidase